MFPCLQGSDCPTGDNRFFPTLFSFEQRKEFLVLRSFEHQGSVILDKIPRATEKNQEMLSVCTLISYGFVRWYYRQVPSSRFALGVTKHYKCQGSGTDGWS